jgi:hypothetical protein
MSFPTLPSEFCIKPSGGIPTVDSEDILRLEVSVQVGPGAQLMEVKCLMEVVVSETMVSSKMSSRIGQFQLCILKARQVHKGGEKFRNISLQASASCCGEYYPGG